MEYIFVVPPPPTGVAQDRVGVAGQLADATSTIE